jgi:molybdopterin-guanine dinucleotide biosynthesis protein A
MFNAAAVILAGGKSTRMGRNKALVPVLEHKMIERIVRLLAVDFSEIIISANDDVFDDIGVRVVPDIIKGSGPLGGIHAALGKSSRENNFFVACDMPFLDTKLAGYMIGLLAGYDIVVPKVGEYYQPLFAAYKKTCLSAIESKLNQGINKIISFYPDVSCRFVSYEEIKKYGDPEKIFFNVNTPVDLETAKVMARGE